MAFQFDDETIKATKAEVKRHNKGDMIMTEGDTSQYFFYLKEGELDVFNFTEEGKEFLQHKVQPGNFFGEPAVLLQQPFPGNVEVYSEKAEIVRIKREDFIQFALLHPQKFLEFTCSVAQKSLRKSLSLKNIVFLNPEERVFQQILDYKKEKGKSKDEKIFIHLTRKELSNMTGLRIETIIRTVKKMEKEGKLEIISGKIFI